MEDIAVQLFKLGDKEDKGFIVKRDMQRLQSEVSLPPDQLEAVFESLDTSHNGYLTLDQFLAGVNHFGNTEADRQTDCETDFSVQQLLGLNVLHKSGELMCEVRSMLGREDTWHQLLAALFSDLNQLLRQISQLEDTLKTRDLQHQEELSRLYEELESQLAEERDRWHNQLRQREASMRSQFAEELAAKEQQITELEDQRDLLQERLRTAQSQLSLQNAKGNKGNKNSTEVENTHSSCNFEEKKQQALMQAERNYAAGFGHAQYLSMLQEESLVKQLRLLQEMQETLKSGQKEERHRKFSCDDI